MAIRDKLMNALIAMRDRYPDGPARESTERYFTSAARLSMLLDGIKLIGKGNGAGALASVAAMNYFSDRAELLLPIKCAAIVFFVGLLVFALAIAAYIMGLLNATGFIDKYAHVEDKTTIPTHALNSAIVGIAFLFFSLLATGASLISFFIGTAIGLYTLINF